MIKEQRISYPSRVVAEKVYDHIVKYALDVVGGIGFAPSPRTVRL